MNCRYDFHEFPALFLTVLADKEYYCFAPWPKSNITGASRQDIDRLLFVTLFIISMAGKTLIPVKSIQMIRNLHHLDAASILQIYQQGLDSGEASFETEAPDWATWQSKYHHFCRLVWEQDGKPVGWAALAPVSVRHCYRGVAEVSIYVADRYLGQGIGSKLMTALIDEAESNGIWSLYASIFPENQATRKLHLRHGFREVGIRERIAQREGRWRDTLILERRSGKVGV